MRILALAVLAAVIVVSGIWLARDRSGTAAPADGAPAATSTATGATATGTSDAADDGAPADTAGASTEATEADDATGANDATDAAGAADDTAGSPSDDGAADATAGDGEPLTDAEVVPQGFTMVPFLTDVAQQAFDAPEQVLDPELDYMAVIRTNRGDITVDLYEDLTPITVNNFVFLALHRYFEGVPFHRVIDGFMAQTGDPTGTGTGGPGYQFDDEIVEGLAFDSEGILAMANAGRGPDGSGTNGSQFFITFAPTEWLTGAHAIFGHVTAGLEVLPEITRIDPTQPSAVVPYTGTVADLAAQGVELPVDDTKVVSDAIEELLGALPGTGQSFSVAGYRAVAGMLGTDPAFGFYLNPDEIEAVVVAARPR
ncbi:MAG: peptidylprolyl isomerase [Trueperaceae bacterium]